MMPKKRFFFPAMLLLLLLVFAPSLVSAAESGNDLGAWWNSLRSDVKASAQAESDYDVSVWWNPAYIGSVEITTADGTAITGAAISKDLDDLTLNGIGFDVPDGSMPDKYKYKAYLATAQNGAPAGTKLEGFFKTTVTKEEKKDIYLTYTFLTLSDMESFGTLSLWDDDGIEYQPGFVNNYPGYGDYGFHYVLPAYGFGFGYNLTVPEPVNSDYGVPISSFYLLENGTSQINAPAFGAISNFGGTVQYSARPKKETIFQVDKGADFSVHQKIKSYYPQKKLDPISVNTANPDYDEYVYKVTDTPDKEGNGFNYVAKKTGKVKQGDIFDPGKTYRIELRDLDNNYREDNGYAEANLYTNVGDSKYLQLAQGETFDLFSFRVWQAISTITLNYFLEPDFHYEVIGDSVTVAEGAKSAYGREYQTITAVKPGVSVIKITYDAMIWPWVEGTNRSYYYNAIDPRNTGVIVVNVGGNNDAHIEANIDQLEFDTIYYDEAKTDHADYTFTPTADAALSVRVHDPVYDTAWGEGWTSYEANQDGSYSVQLKEGRNIIEVAAGGSVQYHVVNARRLAINIENKSNPGQPLRLGETVSITFDGLCQPVQKMAAIYNPGFPNLTWVEYKDGGATRRSAGVQYTVILDNAVDFQLTEAGTVNLTNGQIHGIHLGSVLGYHRTIPEGGMVRNFNAEYSENDPYFSTLPDISFEVLDNEDAEDLAKYEYADLTKISTFLFQKNFVFENPKLERNFSVNTDKEEGHSAFSIQPNPFHEDTTVNARYWKNDGEAAEKNLPIKIIDGYGTQIPHTGIFNDLTLDDIGYTEVTSRPDDPEKGLPQTYTFRVLASNGSAYGQYPYLTDVKVNAVNGANEMTFFDGKLKAVDAGGNDLGLGYGFLATRENFVTTVPYGVDKVTITPKAIQEGDAVTTIKVNGATVASEAASQEIPLVAGGSTDITVEAAVGEHTRSHTITVVRAKEPNRVTFDTLEDASVIVKNAKDKKIAANEDGSFSLPLGNYTAIVSKVGYFTLLQPFEVKDDTTVVVIGAMEAVPEQTGDVSIKVAGLKSALRDDASVTIPEVPDDLAAKKYLEYNHGGYTVLHALIDSFNAGVNKINFSCVNGVLTPQANVSGGGQGPNAGWICEVNDKAVDPATTLVNGGDKVVFYYNPDIENGVHAWFTETVKTVDAGEAFTLQLLTAPIANDGETAPAGLEGASLLVNGHDSGVVTNTEGKATLTLTDAGPQVITAAKKDGNGNNLLTYTRSIVTVKSGEIPDVPGQTTVTFRLIGDSHHDNGVDGHEKYITWIATKTYTFPSDEDLMVYDVFVKALNDAGLEYKGAESNYVSSIRAPKAYGGEWLSEFTNGPNSGWMYTVNGYHPDRGLREWKLNNGDTIVWHYVDDYILEAPFEYNNPQYMNRWLEAVDEDPPATTVTATFNSNGGSAVEPQTIDSGGKLTKPADPTRRGYTFTGWYSDPALKKIYNFNTVVTNDITLYAGWTSSTFKDVPDTAWYAEAVRFVAERSLFDGVAPGVFAPDESMTRAMFVTVLYRYAGEAALEDTTIPFEDVEAGRWYTNAVIWAAREGVTFGTSGKTFEPDKAIAREEIVTMFHRYLQEHNLTLPVVSEEKLFTDRDTISDWAKESVKAMQMAGIIEGMPNNLFAPKKDTTRAEVATIFQRFIKAEEKAAASAQEAEQVETEQPEVNAVPEIEGETDLTVVSEPESAATDFDTQAVPEEVIPEARE